ncbi:hypothetical protein EG329_007257 [Mollisiaceae sp. DMI_Dod_QoI]|nr:hypothetical protein EG329_007257 [Helotiales sp. DMI_Dod_QoI]
MFSTSALVAAVVLRGGYRYILINLFQGLGILLFKLLIILAMAFAKIVGGFFYLLLLVLFDFPSWVLSFASTSDSCPECQQRHGQQKKKIDMPEGWVRVPICQTDEISVFDLNPQTMQLGLHSLENGPWDEREIFQVTKEEIRQRVIPWLDQIIIEEDGSAYVTEEENNERGEGNVSSSISWST